MSITRKWTTQEIVNEYEEASYKIAEMISQLDLFKGRFDALSEYTGDNADPYCDAQDALEALGKLLSSTVIYANEYKKDLKNDKDEEEKK